MLKIMMLINSFNLGGAEKLVYDISEILSSGKQCEVYVCSVKSIQTDLEKSIQQRLELKGVTCLSINKEFQKDRLKAIYRIRNFLRKYKIDVLHTHGQSPDFYGRIATIFLNIKTIVTIHSTADYSRKIEKMLSVLTDCYTAVSKETVEYVKNDLKIKKKIYLIENGIDVKRYQKTELEKNNPFTILSVGRIDQNKGYLEGVSILAPFLLRHKEAIWRIVGNYEEKDYFYKRIIDEIRKYGIEQNVKFVGTTLSPEEEYRLADCFFLNSKHEGFGIAYVEAMAAELPIFGNKVGVILDIFNSGSKIDLIDDDNVVDVMESLYENGSNNIDYIYKNKAIIQEKYSIDFCAKQYLTIYQDKNSTKNSI